MKKYLLFITLYFSLTSLAAQTINYSYDNLGRLTQIVYPDSSIINYTFDASGNRVTNLTKVSPLADANLVNLTLSNGTLSPVFAKGTTAYKASVANSIASITITPTTSNPSAIVKVNGTAVISGTPSQSLPLAVGVNTIPIAVTAKDGTTTKSYTVTVTRGVSTNASLSKLGPSIGGITPTFSGGTTSYTISTGNANASITLTPVSSDANATIKVNGITVASSTTTAPIALTEGGQTVISTIVTAQDGITKQTYTLTVIRAPSGNATLSNLQLNNGTLSPVFATGTVNYSASVANSVSIMTITPTITDLNAAIKVNGTTVTSGTASGAIALAEGAQTVINTVVTAQDGTTTKTYKVTVTRAPSSNATLSKLGPSIGGLTPAFSSGTTSYTISTGNANASMTLTPVSSDANATIKVNGTAVASGTATGPIALTEGGQTVVNTVVTAQDGVTIKTYTFTVTRAPSGIATLSNLQPNNGTLTPAFAGGTASYTVSVANTVSTITITPTTTDANATIKVNGTTVTSGTASGAIALAEGAQTVITTVVTAQNGTTTKTYTLTVARAPSSNATLSKLGPGIGGITPAFSSGTTSYTISTGNANASMTLTPVSSDANATIKVDGSTVASGTATAPIALAESGQTVISTVVTAQDGVTIKTYTLIVSRAAGSNATLSNLQPNAGTLSPMFASTTTSYTVSVANTVSTITITPTSTDANATIKVNGTGLTSGTASTPIALAEGAQTVISTVVTAQNGTTTKTYTLTVTRAPSSNASLSKLGPSIGGLAPAFSSSTTSYTISTGNANASMTLTPVSSDANATIKVNGTAVASGTMTAPMALTVGPNTISTVITAQDGTTTKTYILTVTRASGGADSYTPGISVSKPTESPTIDGDVIVVHQGVSPNGDGINDFLQIDNISQYPDNKLSIMNRNGQLIYEASGYDNSSRVFDGHSNQNGQMQLPGTYFYQLDYTVSGVAKHKTGFLVLKY
jgi:gliding motility-associated-like protein